jgi:hypothetical protein
MSTFDGAFGNLHNFLHFIALPNCLDFFHREQSEREEVANNGQVADVTRRELSRVLFNAVVSLDTVLDYAFHAEGGGPDQGPFNQRLFQKERALAELREISNAMKHCVTRNADRLDGAEVVQTRIHGEAVVTDALAVNVTIQIEAKVISRANDALGNSFRFWLSQGQQMNAYAPRIDLSGEVPDVEV